MTTLAVVMIVKDEASRLGACLDAARAVADEIVIVDTGSSDDTVSIAEQYTAQVHRFPWQDDFAAARNFAIENASSGWCLTLDADEIIADPKQAREQLIRFTEQQSPTTLGCVQILSPTGADADAAVSREVINRLFHRGSYRYQGIIHEQLTAIGEHAVTAADTGVVIQHSGYAQSTDDRAHKSRRNIPLLEKALRDNPHDEYYLFQLGQAHFTAAAFGAAIAAFEKALAAIDFSTTAPTGSQGPVSREVLTSLLTSLCYACINNGAIDRALQLMTQHLALAHAGTQRADFAHALGYLFMMNEQIAEAIAAYELSLQFGPEREDVVGTGSFSSLYHLGLLWETSGDPIKALEHYANAVNANPHYRPALERCIGFIVDYQTELPADLYRLSTPEQWQPVLQQAVERARSGGDEAGLALLLRAAQTISTELHRQLSPVR